MFSLLTFFSAFSFTQATGQGSQQQIFQLRTLLRERERLKVVQDDYFIDLERFLKGKFSRDIEDHRTEVLEFFNRKKDILREQQRIKEEAAKVFEANQPAVHRSASTLQLPRTQSVLQQQAAQNILRSPSQF